MNTPMDHRDHLPGSAGIERLRGDERSVAVPRDQLGRPVLSLDRLAGVIDHRLHLVANLDEVVAGAAKAKRLGLAAVTCRPEHVASVAAELHGSGLGVASAVEFHDAPRLTLRRETIVEEALRLAEAGATDVAIIADATRARTGAVEQVGCSVGGHALDGSPPHGFADAVAALVEVLQPFRARVRAHLEVTSMSEAQAARTAQAAVEAGASMVQAGTWRQDCASFPAVQAIRRVLRPSLPLKWTTPVRSLSMLLFAFGEGVDRFNVDDVDRLLVEARRASMAGPLLAPVAGLDY